MPVATYRTHDIDEAIDIGRRVFFENELTPGHDREAFAFDLKVTSLGGMAAGVFSYGSEIDAHIGGADMSYAVGVPLSGALRVRDEHMEVVADPQTAAVVQPESSIWLHGWRGNEETVLLRFDPTALETELERMIGREIHGPVRFKISLDLRTQPGASWWALATSLVLPALAPGTGLADHPQFRAQAASAITTGLLLAADHPYRDEIERRTSNVPSRLVHRAIRVLEERAREPVTISEVAAEVGCSVRSLHGGFQRHLGTTPYRYLQRIRLDGARADLVANRPGTASVRAVAAKWGFAHVGRFSSAYREAYGEKPSATLRDH